MKKKTTRRQVLLSFLGTTDPIRGERDGACLLYTSDAADE